MGVLKGHNIKIFSDGANIEEMVRASKEGSVDGFTTNPTLMRKAGATDYTAFAKAVLRQITDKPISIEVIADDIPTMELEARRLAGLGSNVYVKIPVTNTKGDSTARLVEKLSMDGIRLNVTAILTLEQVRGVALSLDPTVPSIVSVFAGRIADTGVDPVPIMRSAGAILGANRRAELLWASSREALNIVQAEVAGCHIITVTPDILKKAATMFGKDLRELSLDTVKMFYTDAQAAGLRILEPDLKT